LRKKRVKNEKREKKPKVDEEVDFEEREKAKRYLKMMPCNYPLEIVESALDEVRYPYGLQKVMQKILERSEDEATKFLFSRKPKPFQPKNEMKFKEKDSRRNLNGRTVRKRFEGKMYQGTVVGKSKSPDDMEWFKVRYEDGDEEDLDGYEVIHHLYPPSEIPSCLGRKFVSLELFAGSCVLSDAFYQQGWNVDSVDNDSKSNASLKLDILNINPYELDRVPDFIWVSPPCDDFNFMKMVHIMSWAKSKHPHLLVVIESPFFKLDMPLMKECVCHFNLQNVRVVYGKKPTHLWTNFPALVNHLKQFTSNQASCCAMTVARFVNSKFTLDAVNLLEAAVPYNGTKPIARKPTPEVSHDESESD